MNGLVFLTSEDFCIKTQADGRKLCHGIKGFSLIFFYSTNCPHCHAFIPLFKKLAGHVGGCQFGMVNVSTNKNCVVMSYTTITQITEVPYIVFYLDGIPLVRYKGPQDIEIIKEFVVEMAAEVSKRLKPQQQQRGGGRQQQINNNHSNTQMTHHQAVAGIYGGGEKQFYKQQEHGKQTQDYRARINTFDSQKIPEYCICHPLYGNDFNVCYLEMGDAYGE